VENGKKRKRGERGKKWGNGTASAKLSVKEKENWGNEETSLGKGTNEGLAKTAIDYAQGECVVSSWGCAERGRGGS